MENAKNLISKIAISGLGFLSMASSALAYEYTYEYDLGSGGEVDAFAGLFAGGFTLLWVCIMLLGCVFLVFNVWMLVDVIKRTEAELPNRTLWLVLLIAGLLLGFGGIVALVYFFSARKKLVK